MRRFTTGHNVEDHDEQLWFIYIDITLEFFNCFIILFNLDVRKKCE
jgi:hypothetical protein